jgi:dihydrofolate synthase/folylpolyglutamate synthase
MVDPVHDPVAARLAEVGLEFGHGLAIDLSRITAALVALGNPHTALPPVIHVAGTNGKGSTCAFLRAILEAAGLRVHVFTSPHLIHARERVRLAGALVSDAAFLEAIEAVAACGVAVTFFETVTAAAFLLFARTPADYVVLEVGMGGLYDATNVITAPAVSVITPVDLDHQAFLGDTIGDIAVQKAGILKPGRAGVIGRQAAEASAAIDAAARARGCQLWAAGRDFDAVATPAGMALQTDNAFIELPPPGLLGPHQIDNAGLAAAAVLMLADPRICADALARGIAAARWPGRLQPIVRGRLGARAEAAGVSLLVDGAHNPHGARALAAALAPLHARAPARTALICGMFANKDADSIFSALRTSADQVFTTPVEGGRAAASPRALADIARLHGIDAAPTDSFACALDAAFAAVGRGGRIVVCGSLHLAGAAIAQGGGVD